MFFLFLNHFTWTLASWIPCKSNFYERGMKNLYDSVNAMKIWKSIVSHTSCIIQTFYVRPALNNPTHIFWSLVKSIESLRKRKKFYWQKREGIPCIIIIPCKNVVTEIKQRLKQRHVQFPLYYYEIMCE